MGRRCKNCVTLFGLCLISCRARADTHDHGAGEVRHSGDADAHAHEHSAGTDFVSYLATNSPEAHVQHLYEESGATSGILSWLIDATRCVVSNDIVRRPVCAGRKPRTHAFREARAFRLFSETVFFNRIIDVCGRGI